MFGLHSSVGKALSVNVEAMDSNAVEAPNIFSFGLNSQARWNSAIKCSSQRVLSV